MGITRSEDENISEHIMSHGLKRSAFLAAFRETGNVRLACAAADVGRSSHYRWLESDPDYQDAFEQAKEDAADLLEAEARRRAVQGVSKPTGWYKGQPGGYVTEYSDTLLIFLMKGLIPETYGDKMRFAGSVANMDLSRLPAPLLQRIAAGEHPMAVLASATEDTGRTPAEILQIKAGPNEDSASEVAGQD